VTPPLQVAVLADTHVRSGRTLPDDVWDRLRGADVILHAGDVTSPDLVRDLRGVAPLHVVLGNNDHELVGSLPERLTVDLAGTEVAMVHDSGARAGRERRLHRWFPTAAVVVFGHSHDPVDHEGEQGQRLFNPGSPTQRRRQPRPTMGWLTIAGGHLAHHEIIAFDR
jgi:putative phosphoesterase